MMRWKYCWRRKTLGSLGNDEDDRNENGTKSIGLDKENNNFARATRFFVHFFAVVARLQRETAFFSRFLEDGNKRQQFAFSFPELWRSPLEFNSKKIAYIWRIEGGGISAIKFEAAQIHFLRGQSG